MPIPAVAHCHFSASLPSRLPTRRRHTTRCLPTPAAPVFLPPSLTYAAARGPAPACPPPCRHTTRFLVIWLALLPFNIYAQCGWVTVFSSVVLGFFLLSIEEIGVTIEVSLRRVAGVAVSWSCRN